MTLDHAALVAGPFAGSITIAPNDPDCAVLPAAAFLSESASYGVEITQPGPNSSPRLSPPHQLPGAAPATWKE